MGFSNKDFEKEMRNQSKKYKELAKIQRQREKEKLKKKKSEGDFVKKFNKLKKQIKISNPFDKIFQNDKNKNDKNKRNSSNGLNKNKSKPKKLSLEYLKLRAKRKAKKKIIKITILILVPLFFVISTFFGLFMLTAAINNAGLVATIAGIANPTERARLKAMNLLGDEKVTSIPKELIGPEPDLLGSSAYSTKNYTNDSSENQYKNGSMEQNAYMIYLHYKGKLTDEMICGMLGCFQAESKINPHSFETDYLGKFTWEEAKSKNFDPVKMYGPNWATDLYPFSINQEAYKTGHGGSIFGLGLAQWTGPRAYNLTKFSEGFDTMKAQLDFMDKVDKRYGFDGTKNWKYWAHSNNPEGETQVWAKYFEGSDATPDRLSNARTWYNKIKDGSIKVALPGKTSVKKTSSKKTSKKASKNNTSSGKYNPDENEKWIIQRESGGNPHARNGVYYGIGQLTESYYAKFVEGKDYKDSKVVQLEAMRKYIQGRYGNSAAAKAFWVANGWY